MGQKKNVRTYVRKTGKVVPSHLRSQPSQKPKKTPKIMFERKPVVGEEQDERPGQGWISTASGEKLWIGPKVNLSGKNLAGLPLRGADLREANLDRAVLDGTDLRNANLENASLAHAQINKTKLGGADLRGVNWRGIDMKNLSDALLDEEDIFSLYSTKYDKHSFAESAESWQLSDSEFERLVTSGKVEVRDNGSHIRVLYHFNPWEHHIAGWQHQNPPFFPKKISSLTP